MSATLTGKRIFIAGHRGLVGSALARRLDGEDCEVLVAGREQLDLTEQTATRAFLAREKPDVVIIAAAKVGGIHANNSFPADFIHENLMIAANLVEAAHRADVNRLLFLGSTCIYPRLAPQPMAESALLTGPLEPTNEWYAIAKIAGIKLAQAYRRQHGRDYISALPTNLYGPGDNYDLAGSHVLPALIRKAHEARISDASYMTVWGSGAPLREFMHADDCADACVFLLENYSAEGPINIGSGQEIAIAALAELIAGIVGYEGAIRFDGSKPDGTPRKLVDWTRLKDLGWKPSISLEEGIRAAYAAFQTEMA